MEPGGKTILLPQTLLTGGHRGLLLLQEFWQLLVSACKTGSGIPQKFLDEKAEEIRKRKEEEERIQVRGSFTWQPL